MYFRVPPWNDCVANNLAQTPRERYICCNIENYTQRIIVTQKLNYPPQRSCWSPSLPKYLKGLSHEMDLAFDYMYG